MTSAPDYPLRLGFGCAWAPSGDKTWSYIPASLREALAERLTVLDIDPRPPAVAAAVLKGIYMRRSEHGWRSLWKWSPPAEALTERLFLRAVRRARPDAVLQIGDYGDPNVPFFLYQDLSFGTLERRYEELSRFVWIPLDVVRRRREHQERLYGRVSGVFTMSDWLAADLRANSSVDPAKVHSVWAGMNVRRDCPPVASPIRPAADRCRLLFVGRDFERKGGDLVVEAFRILRSAGDRQMTLTIAGPPRWPLPGEPPAGVRFLGEVPLSKVAQLYGESDLFVMPSRFEPFGLVFLEALAYGLPCIGRDDFAMPEVILPGRNGALVSGDSADQLAALTWAVLNDDSVYEQCSRSAAQVVERYSWGAVVDRMLPVIADAVGAGPPTPAP